MSARGCSESEDMLKYDRAKRLVRIIGGSPRVLSLFLLSCLLVAFSDCELFGVHPLCMIEVKHLACRRGQVFLATSPQLKMWQHVCMPLLEPTRTILPVKSLQKLVQLGSGSSTLLAHHVATHYSNPKRPHKHKDPTSHNFWYPPHSGRCIQKAGSLCSWAPWGPS